jgi:hypothetical protein
MAAAIKAINAKIRSNKVLDYVCSTRTYRSSTLSECPNIQLHLQLQHASQSTWSSSPTVPKPTNTMLGT